MSEQYAADIDNHQFCCENLSKFIFTDPEKKPFLCSDTSQAEIFPIQEDSIKVIFDTLIVIRNALSCHDLTCPCLETVDNTDPVTTFAFDQSMDYV